MYARHSSTAPMEYHHPTSEVVSRARAGGNHLWPLVVFIALTWQTTELRAQADLTAPKKGQQVGTHDNLDDTEDTQIIFRVAENTFRYQDYGRAIELFEQLLYPEVLLDEDKEQQAREYLGASHWFQQNYERAEEEFTSLLIRHPQHQLDPFYYPAGLISYFETVLHKLIRLRVIVPDEEPEPDLVAPSITQERILERRSLALCFVPFGVGQFQNGDIALGITFLTIETVALATNIASYFVIQSLREPSGFIAAPNMKTARTYETVLYASMGVFAAAAVAGIIQALVAFEPEEETIRELPPREPQAKQPVGLSLGPTGANVRLSF